MAFIAILSLPSSTPFKKRGTQRLFINRNKVVFVLIFCAYKKGDRLFMEKASKVMYSIANFFTWVLVVLSIAGIVVASLGLAKIITFDNALGTIVYLSIILIIAIITIALVRKAKADGSSKGWDLLFLILGIVGGNIFYFLGGLFGLIARR